MENSLLKSVRRSSAKASRFFHKKAVNEGRAQDKILSEHASFHVKEAYKVLRTNIIFSLPTEGCKRIIVTSSLASEGKSTTCLNLAITFAETGARVLLIDCDLRRPNVSKLLEQPASPGLSNVLVRLKKVEQVIRRAPNYNLDVIYSGDIPPNPAELLGSDGMRDLLEQLSNHYDYIFLDTSPVNLVADTSILSKFVSGVVVVAQYNETEKDTVSDAVGQLQFVGAKILGLVLNRMEYNQKNAYKYKAKGKGYYRYSYHHYGQDSSGTKS